VRGARFSYAQRPVANLVSSFRHSGGLWRFGRSRTCDHRGPGALRSRVWAMLAVWVFNIEVTADLAFCSAAIETLRCRLKTRSLVNPPSRPESSGASSASSSPIAARTSGAAGGQWICSNFRRVTAVLDLGCGPGVALKACLKRLEQGTAAGLDHSEVIERQSPEPLEVYDASLATGRPVDEIVADRYGDYLRSIFPDRSLMAVVVGGTAFERSSSPPPPAGNCGRAATSCFKFSQL